MKRPQRVCILGCSASTTGELTLAFDWVRRLKRPVELHAVVPSTASKTARHAGATVHAYPNLGPRTALPRIRESLAQLDLDIVVIADLILYYGLVGEFAGALPRVVEAACPKSALVGLDLYDWDANRHFIDVFGRAAMAPFTDAATTPPPTMGRLMPSPYLAPRTPSPGRGRYAMMESAERASSAARAAVREELGIAGGKLVLWTTSPWQHLAEIYVESSRVAKHLPHLLMRVLDLAARPADGVTLVHLGPTPYSVPDDVKSLRYLHVSQLPPDRFGALLSAADLMITPNVIASSAIRAASMGIPVVALHLDRAFAAPFATAATAPQRALQRFSELAAPTYATSVWPLGMHTLLEQLLHANPFHDIEEHLRLSDPDATVDRLHSVLGDASAADALRHRQDRYFRELSKTVSTADDALDAALQARSSGKRRPAPKTDPIQAAWKSALPYLWDRDFQARLVEGNPRARPGAGSPFWQVWPQCQTHSLCDVWRAENLCARFLEVAHLDGDVIECGTWQGGISVMYALLCKRLGLKKRVHMFDSFQGLPQPLRGVDKFHQKGWCSATRDTVEELIRRCEVEDHVVIREGWFKDTLPTLTTERFCLAHFDGDLYESTRDCLQHVMPRMVQSGVILVDDYHDSGEGVRRAIDGYIAESGEELHVGPIPQVYFRRGVNGGTAGAPSLDELRANAAYTTMVQEVARVMKRDAETVARMRRLLDGK